MKTFDKVDLNILVSNIVSENRYSHCRLCLKEIRDDYVRFEDCVCLDIVNGVFQPLSDIITKLLNADICEEITGIDAVCPECVEKALEATRFRKKCQESTNLLNSVFDNLMQTLNVDIDTTNRDHSLFVIVDEQETKLILMNNQHRSNNINKKNHYECYECNEAFENFADFKEHHMSYHDSLICEKCYETYPNESDFYSHSSCKHRIKCPDCLQYKATEECLKEHQEEFHSIYVCKYCGKSYRGLEVLQNHEAKHTIKNECPKCGKTYQTKDFFIKHVKLCLKGLIDPHPTRSNIEKPYSCEKCGKSYSTSGGLRVHNRFVHDNAKPHVCVYCGKQFTAPSYLKVHMIKHTGEKNFKCSICGNRFVSKEALLYHTRRHTGEKPYSCKYCDERFVNASARAEHIKFKHIGPTLMCEICSRKFVTRNFLKQHIGRHHDPTSKLYCGRSMIPPNMPGEQNMRTFKIATQN